MIISYWTWINWEFRNVFIRGVAQGKKNQAPLFRLKRRKSILLKYPFPQVGSLAIQPKPDMQYSTQACPSISLLEEVLAGLCASFIATENNPFESACSSAIIKMLERYYPKDFSIKEIAEESHYYRGTVSTYLKVLVAEKTVIITRSFGKINLYSIVKKE